MKGTGIFKVSVDGEEVGLRFGMLSSSYTEELSGKTIYEIFKGIAAGRTTPMLQYFYGALRAYNHYAKIKKDIDLGDVALVIDQNTDEAMKIYTESLKMFLDETDKAEKTEGEPSAA